MIKFILVPAADVRLCIFDIVAQSAGRPPLYLCDLNGAVVMLTQRQVDAFQALSDSFLMATEVQSCVNLC